MANVYASIPPTGPQAWYRLGPTLAETGDDVVFNTTHDDGTHLVCGEPYGWEGLEFVTPIDTVGGRDGGLLGPQSVAPRLLEVEGMAVAPTARTLRLLIRRIKALLGPRVSVAWSQYDFGAGERLGLICRGTGDFRATPVMGHQPGGVATRINFTLVAANPVWKQSTGDPDQVCAGLPSGVVTGRTYDKTYDWDYGGIIDPGGQITATNRGDRQAWPVFAITGPVEDAIVMNDTTGQSFMVAGVIPAGVTVTIDARTGVVDPTNYRLVGRPWLLQPGQNDVRWRAVSGSSDPDALMCISWRSTWE